MFFRQNKQNRQDEQLKSELAEIEIQMQGFLKELGYECN